jgi:uncharacterized protein YdhG (YjbR/CyaY superfamily)
MMRGKKPETIDAYIALFPREVQDRLERLRRVIQQAAPNAEEAIRYQMPTFRLAGKNLVHFAPFAHHIGFYPIPSGITAFKKELSVYKQGKGSVRFPLNQPLPYDLVKQIVRYRVDETMASMKKSRSRSSKRKKKG